MIPASRLMSVVLATQAGLAAASLAFDPAPAAG